MTPSDVAWIRGRITRNRDGGFEVFKRPPAADARGSADATARSVALRVLGDDWREEDRETVAAYLTWVLTFDLLAGNDRMPAVDAERLAASILDAVGPARYFASGAIDGTYAPVSDATFDAAVVVVGVDEVAIVWVRDED